LGYNGWHYLSTVLQFPKASTGNHQTCHREHSHYTQLQAEKGDTCYDKDIAAKLIYNNKFIILLIE